MLAMGVFVFDLTKMGDLNLDFEDHYESDYESLNDLLRDFIDREIDYDFKIKKSINGRYEWGFDLTDFNDYNQRGELDGGALKFKRLIRKFRLTNYSVNKGFTWSNDDNSLILITSNHPITGKSCDDAKTEREPGYLGLVGVTCTSAELLEEFIKAFRSCASYIREESNYREYF